MKKLNLLSKAELKKVLGGMDEAQRGVFPCLTDTCSFYVDSMIYYGNCGSTLDLKGCYCLATAPNGSLYISDNMPSCYTV